MIEREARLGSGIEDRALDFRGARIVLTPQEKNAI
jgi:hypothetical protein